MMGIADLVHTCGGQIEQKRIVSTQFKRAPPSAQCAEGIRGRAANLLSQADEGAFRQIIPANMQNPFNAGADPNGAVAPNINVNGVLVPAAVYRQRFGRQHLDLVRQNQLLVGSIVSTVIVVAEVYDLIVDGVARLGVDEQTKLKTSDAQCPENLVCLDENCQGIKKIWPTIPIFSGPTVYQTGRCTAVSERHDS